MNTAETYVAVTVTLLFLTGLGWLGRALRESKRLDKLWPRRT
jgi:hypothetical protein